MKLQKINFSSYFKIFNYISLFLFISSIILILFKGLNYGVDFKGGTIIEIRTKENINISQIRNNLSKFELGDLAVKEFGKKGDFILKFEKKLSDNNNEITKIENSLKIIDDNVDLRRVESVGPKVSKELMEAGIISICLALTAMLFYIWIRFEWQFSIGSIIALIHDVTITLGIFSLLSIEINLSIVAAVLTIVGYSMNDTVVIYDRIRENLNKFNYDILEISNISLNETLSRTLITSFTTLLALFSIFFLGGEILRGFSFAMILGVIIGSYSSIFIASPILKFLKVTYKTMLKDKETENSN
tara:strand:- start:1147 stop:2052 length:906 start_codon:yes stop_codon:yes gene_type:complete